MQARRLASPRPRGALLPTLVVAFTATWLAGCASDGVASTADAPRKLPVEDAGDDAATDFALIEERLLSLGTVYLDFQVSFEGVVNSHIEGTLVLQSGQAARLAAGGTFDDRPVSLRLESDGSQISGGSASGDFQEPTPRALREGLVLGLTRMGLLHNLAKLSSGLPPDATDGTARLWVKPTDIRRGKAQVGPDRTLLPFHFGILVSGRPSGEATLWVDADTFLPVRREQTVIFPEGEMRVVERYPLVDVGGVGGA